MERIVTYKIVGPQPWYATVEQPGNPTIRVNSDGTTTIRTGGDWNQVDGIHDPWLLFKVRAFGFMLNRLPKVLGLVLAAASVPYIAIVALSDSNPRSAEWLESRLYDLGLFGQQIGLAVMFLVAVGGAASVVRTMWLGADRQEDQKALLEAPRSVSRCSANSLAILVASERIGDNAEVALRFKNALPQMNQAQRLFLIVFRDPMVRVYNHVGMAIDQGTVPITRTDWPDHFRQFDRDGIFDKYANYDAATESWSEYLAFLNDVWPILVAYATAMAAISGQAEQVQRSLTARPIVFSSSPILVAAPPASQPAGKSPAFPLVPAAEGKAPAAAPVVIEEL